MFAAPTSLSTGTSNAFAVNDLTLKFRKISTAAAAPRVTTMTPKKALVVENLHGMSGRKCMLTGKKANNGRTVSFSHIRTKTLQQANLQYKRIYWPEQKRYVRLRISTNALKSLNKLGLEEMAKRAGLDLMSMSFNDADPARKQWLKEQSGGEPALDKRAPKGPKPLYVPKWKEAKLAKMSAEAAKAEKARFAAANNMIVA
jgi:large subunit ribosomal protein L28